jgi:hypothetical protein
MVKLTLIKIEIFDIITVYMVWNFGKHCCSEDVIVSLNFYTFATIDIL